MERKPFNWSELFEGNWNLLKEGLNNPETIFVYDMDGILTNTSKAVLENFSKKYGVRADPTEIDEPLYLTNLAKKKGLGTDVIEHAEDGWFEPDLLLAAQRYLYTKSTVLKTIRLYGADRNFVLTSRNHEVGDITIDWFARELPEIKRENILIRNYGDVGRVDSVRFKVENLKILARKAPWVVFVDDSVKFCKAALSEVENCLVIFIPVGKMVPGFSHERLFVIKRYPNDIQAIYPLVFALDKANIEKNLK